MASSCPGDSSTRISQILVTIGNYGANSVISNNTTITNENRAQYFSNLTRNNIFYILNKCRKTFNKYPSFTPVIFSLSVTSSKKGSYSLVYINGENFLPVTNGTTYVNFGEFKNLPITYYSSNTISFVVPLNANTGNYQVNVVNVYNSNFSTPVNYTYSGTLNFSNPENYTIT